MVWRIDDPQCAESRKVVWEVARWLRGRGLDIGAGDFKVLPHVISVDNLNHIQFGFTHRPDIVAEAEDLSIFGSQSMDFVYSSHTLEHVVNWKAALKEWWRVIKPNGLMVLYLPHKLFYPNIGEKGANPDHKHDFLPDEIIDALPEGHDVLVKEDRNNDNEYSMLIVVRKLHGRHKHRTCNLPKPTKTACVVRYGAYGDLMQSSSVWSALKAEGYHVSVITSGPGCDVLTHDPNIDDLIIYDKDQVPNAQLNLFWAYQKTRFDKFVNLSESIEGTLLALPGRTIHFFPPAVRESLTNRNYVEFQHALAGVPYRLQSKFYNDLSERAWSSKERDKAKGPLIMWSLAGSSVHKTWAGLDNILACILVDFPTATVVLVGGPECAILEAGWENEPRIWKKSGVYGIRETLSLALRCDLVIGSETGVLNAMACENMKKIVFLSHSTGENLTRDWTNTISLKGVGTVCKGRGNDEAAACHQLHYGWDHCTQHKESGVAQCQADIPIQAVWDVVRASLEENPKDTK